MLDSGLEMTRIYFLMLAKIVIQTQKHRDEQAGKENIDPNLFPWSFIFQ